MSRAVNAPVITDLPVGSLTQLVRTPSNHSLAKQSFTDWAIIHSFGNHSGAGQSFSSR
jgi:hypothetical protein